MDLTSKTSVLQVYTRIRLQSILDFCRNRCAYAWGIPPSVQPRPFLLSVSWFFMLTAIHHLLWRAFQAWETRVFVATSSFGSDLSVGRLFLLFWFVHACLSWMEIAILQLLIYCTSSQFLYSVTSFIYYFLFFIFITGNIVFHVIPSYQIHKFLIIFTN